MKLGNYLIQFVQEFHLQIDHRETAKSFSLLKSCFLVKLRPGVIIKKNYPEI